MAYGYLKIIGIQLASWSRILGFPVADSKSPQHKQILPLEEVDPDPSVSQKSSKVSRVEDNRLEENIFSPNRYFLGLIQATLREGLARKYARQGCADIIVIPDKQLYYSSAKLEDLKPFFETPVKNIKVSLIDIKKLDNIINQLIAKSQPIDDLLWCAAQYGSKGRLLKSANPNSIIQLKYWPDIAHLPDYRQYLPLAAFLNNNATDIPTIAEQTNTPLALVHNFYNACATLGLLEKMSQALLQNNSDKTSDHALYENISATLDRCVTDSSSK